MSAHRCCFIRVYICVSYAIKHQFIKNACWQCLMVSGSHPREPSMIRLINEIGWSHSWPAVLLHIAHREDDLGAITSQPLPHPLPPPPPLSCADFRPAPGHVFKKVSSACGQWPAAIFFPPVPKSSNRTRVFLPQKLQRLSGLSLRRWTTPTAAALAPCRDQRHHGRHTHCMIGRAAPMARAADNVTIGGGGSFDVGAEGWIH